MIFAIGFFIADDNGSRKKKAQEHVAQNYKNATYIIDGERITLVNGVSETAMSDSASKIITRYFGNEVRKDLNGDEREDSVFLLTQDRGGSGTFFYAVAAVAVNGGYLGSEAFFLGDRIAPQTTNAGKENSVIVNYAVRTPGEPMTVRPSIGKSVWLVLDPASMRLRDVSKEFMGR